MDEINCGFNGVVAYSRKTGKWGLGVKYEAFY
jgi:hypothetical protein